MAISVGLARQALMPFMYRDSFGVSISLNAKLLLSIRVFVMIIQPDNTRLSKWARTVRYVLLADLFVIMPS